MTDFAALRESADVFKQLVEMAVKIVHADVACFYLVNESLSQAIPIASAKADDWVAHPLAGVGNELMTTEQFPLSADSKVQKLIYDVVKDDRPLLIARNNPGSCLGDGLCSFMLAPLKIRSKPTGRSSVP